MEIDKLIWYEVPSINVALLSILKVLDDKKMLVILEFARRQMDEEDTTHDD